MQCSFSCYDEYVWTPVKNSLADVLAARGNSQLDSELGRPPVEWYCGTNTLHLNRLVSLDEVADSLHEKLLAVGCR